VEVADILRAQGSRFPAVSMDRLLDIGGYPFGSPEIP
jgi:hypothetical protein